MKSTNYRAPRYAVFSSILSLLMVKFSLQHPSNRWVDDDFKEMACEGVDWIELVQDRIQCPFSMNILVKLPVP